MAAHAASALAADDAAATTACHAADANNCGDGKVVSWRWSPKEAAGKAAMGGAADDAAGAATNSECNRRLAHRVGVEGARGADLGTEASPAVPRAGTTTRRVRSACRRPMRDGRPDTADEEISPGRTDGNEGAQGFDVRELLRCGIS